MASKQISPLAAPTRYMTTHDPQTAKAILHSTENTTWSNLDNDSMGFSVPYATSQFPVNMTDEADIKQHEKAVESGNLGLVNPGGTVCRIVDFAPGNKPIMHRTVSLDYGIVVEGSVEMGLDSGETRVLKRGDVAVQRGTMHSWKNVSDKEWARMVFVLQSSEKVVVGGRPLEEIPHDTEIKGSE